MKRVILCGCVIVAIIASVAMSRTQTESTARVADTTGLQVKSEDKNPWTNLQLNVAPDQFQFAVVSDRTGGHREKVFSKAVLQVNLLQPQFVMCVGDLIEGYTTKEESIKQQWDEFDGYVKKFEMPFFYNPGNHDMANKTLVQKWGERYGRRYYHFTYKNVLFLSLCSDNPPNLATIDAEQQEYVRKTLDDNKGVRWTFVFVHRPLWTAKDLEKNGWSSIEKSLGGRKYTVFCGHEHRYQKFIRNGMNYYQLATTGGGSLMRGLEYGEFDQIAWITMKKDAPLIANVMLDGILPEDLKIPESNEKGVVVKKVPTFPVTGTVTLDGAPLAGATVRFSRYDETRMTYARVADSLTDSTGRFQLSTYSRFDGCPAGTFVITVVKMQGGYDDGEAAKKSLLPEKYAKPATSPLKATVKDGPNDVKLELTEK